MAQAVLAKTEYAYDPRTRLTIVLCLSSLSVFISDVRWLLGIFAAAFLLTLLFKGKILFAVKQFKWLLPMFVMLCFAQSLFGAAEGVLLQLGSLKLLSLYGIRQAALFSLRIVIVVLSATILLPESSRRMIQALSQMHCPYELAFMVTTAVRFMSVIREEFSNSLHAVQMRGADLKHIPMDKRMKVYTYILLPVMSSTLFRARQLSISLDLRGFRRSKERSSYFRLKMSAKDWMIIILALAITAACLLIYFL